MAQRYEINNTVQGVVEQGANQLLVVGRGFPSGAGLTVTVKDLVGDNLTVYEAETGATTLANPLTSDPDTGRIEGWVEEPDYDLAVSGTGITPYTESIRRTAAVNASEIIGSIEADQIGSVNASSIIGSITAGQIGSVNASAITGLIAANQINTITAGQITGTITAGQIGTITAGQITGSITAGQITTITAGQITGTITAGQIGTITAGQITGSINAGQIGGVSAGTITGGITAGQVTSINAGSIGGTGTIGSTYLNVATLSALTADMGTLTAGTLRIGVAGGTKVAIGDSISTSAGTKSGIVGTDSSNAITFWADPATGNVQLKGSVLSGSSGLGNISGTINGSTNIASATIPGGNLIVGTITTSQIATDTIAATNIAASAIGVSELAAASVNASKIVANTITANEIAALTITGAEITSTGWIEAKKFRTASSGARIEFDPTSLRKYDASGNVSVKLAAADGLDLLAGSTTTPPEDRKIRWLRAGTSDPVVELVAHKTDAATSSFLGIHALSQANGPVVAQMIAVGIDNEQTGVRARNDTTNAQVELFAHKSGTAKALVALDHTGGSEFLQLPSAIKARVISGRVNADGTEATGGTDGFSSAKNSTGNYTVTFATSFAAAPAVTATARAHVIQAPTVTASAVTFDTFVSNTAVNADRAFDFVAVGV